MALDRVAGRAAITVISPARRTEPTDRPTSPKPSRCWSAPSEGAMSGGFGGILGGRTPPSGRVQPVAEAPHRGDGHGVTQLLADLGHVDVDGAGVAVPAVTPHAVE